MRIRLLFLLSVISVLGADPETVQRKVIALTETGDRALASGKAGAAEEAYKAAIRECNSLPPDKYHCRTDGLWKLARLYSHMKDAANAVSVYKKRLAILLAHQKSSMRPDLDIGIALFDLQTVLEGADLTSSVMDPEGLSYMERARNFYEQCKVQFLDLAKICDRRLADVQGMHGAILTLKKRHDEAVLFLKAVIDRPDSGVRTEIMVAALNSYATILIIKEQPAEAQKFIERSKRLSAQK